MINKNKKYLYFFSQEQRIKWHFIFARELKKRFNIPSICVVEGSRGAFYAERTKGYDNVVNILEGFNPFNAEFRSGDHRAKIAKWEEQWNDFRFFQSLAADRRLNRGRFSEDFSVSYAVHIKSSLENLFEKYPPLIMIGEVNKLSLEIAHHLCESMDVSYLSVLFAGHFDDRIYFEEDLKWSWKHFRQLYGKYYQEGLPDEIKQKIESKYNEITTEQYHPAARYRNEIRGPRSLPDKMKPFRVQRYIEHLKYDVLKDHSRTPGGVKLRECNPFKRIIGEVILGKIRQWRFDALAQEKLDEDRPFVCYFLHAQPEYVVEGLGFEFQNQTELIKNIAAALPADVTLYVKEHTPMVGKRPISHYKQLKQIPNVRLISDKIDSHQLIKKSRVVLTINGTVGIEAVFYGTPAIIFGDIFYSEVEAVHQIKNLGSELRSALKKIIRNQTQKPFSPEKNALALLGAMYDASYPVLVPPFFGRNQKGLFSEESQKSLGDALIKELKRRSLLFNKNEEPSG